MADLLWTTEPGQIDHGSTSRLEPAATAATVRAANRKISYGHSVSPSKAIERIRELRAEGQLDPDDLLDLDVVAWQARVYAVLSRSLGEQHHLTQTADRVSFNPRSVVGGMPRSVWDNAHRRGIGRMVSYLDAAVFELELIADEAEPVDAASFDPELWEHVRGLVEHRDWGKVPPETAIFVEDRVRAWSGLGRDKFGKGLYVSALGDGGALLLGQTAGEHEGWRALGVGLAQAIGNVDRHRIQSRSDARRYAIGVLGLGSLLLTQVRYEHPDAIQPPFSE